MTKEEKQIKIINKKISELADELGSIYAKSGSKLTAEEMKEEVRIKKEMVALKKKRKALRESISNTEKEANVVLFEENKEENSKSKKRENIVFGIVSSLLAIALVAVIISNSRKNKTTYSGQISEVVTFSTIDQTKAPVITPTPTPEVGFDATKETELIAQVKKVYDIDLTPFISELDEQARNQITEETIADIISVSSAELPTNRELGPNTARDLVGLRGEIFGDLPSSPMLEDKIYPVHYSYLVDDEEMQKYAESYDEIYNAIAASRNDKDMEKTIEHIKTLGVKQYNEFVLGGLYGGYNPYSLGEYKQFALGTSVERYASYVLEFIDSNHLTICVPVCIDYETHETKEVNVVDIYEAILMGRSMNKKVYMSYFGDNQVIQINKVFGEELEETLEYKNDLKLKRG